MFYRPFDRSMAYELLMSTENTNTVYLVQTKAWRRYETIDSVCMVKRNLGGHTVGKIDPGGNHFPLNRATWLK